jgi:hypothetical protein
MRNVRIREAIVCSLNATRCLNTGLYIVEKLLELVFSNSPVTKLYKENQQDPKPELSNMEIFRRVPVNGGCNQAVST